MCNCSRLAVMFCLLFCLLLFPGAVLAYDVSGTVGYAGAKSGRIYITLKSDRGRPGTSIPATGAFTIRGVLPGAYTVESYMDTGNTGVRLVTDPVATPQTVTVVSSPVTGVTVTLTDPPPVATVPPPLPPNIIPGDGGALVMWDGNNSGDGAQADSLNLYWSTSSLVSPGNYTGSMTGIPYRSATDKAITLSGLANGTQLYFVSTARLGGIESAASPVVGPVTIGNPAGGYPVSGTISFPAVSGSVPLYLALVVDNKNGPPTGGYLLKYSGPLTSPRSFSFPAVANGTYRLYAILDNNGNGMIDVGDYMSADGDAPLVTVNNAGVSGVASALTANGAFVDFRTNHWTHSIYGQGYVLNFSINAAAKRPVSATLTGGPHVTGPIDVGCSSDRGDFSSWVDIGSFVPAVNDTYTFSLVYSDGSTGTVTGTVTGVVNDFATPVAPVGNVSYASAPTFSWTAPANPPANHTYRVEVEKQGAGRFWESNDIPGNQTAAAYNFDNRANSSALDPGAIYTWYMTLADARGNMSMSQANFAFPGSQLSIMTESLSNAGQSSAYSQQLTAIGGTPPYNWALQSGSLPTGVSLDQATGLISGTPSVSGNNSFLIQVSDSTVPVMTSAKWFNITVQPPAPLQFLNGSLPGGIKGTAYSQQVNVTGGVSPYSFTVTAGTFPGGLVLNSNGLISGTPTTAGTYSFTIQVGDSAQATASKDFSVTIADNAPTMIFGGVYHVTRADGTEADFLDLGTSVVAATKGGLSATVAGPNGFAYSFVDGDIVPYLGGQLMFSRQFASLTPGVYTFTLNDGQGHVSQRVDTHVAGVKLPVVDSSTIQFQRKSDGSYRVRWAPVNDTKTYSYRLRVQTLAGAPVYLGQRRLEGYDDLPANAVTSGTAYQVRIETQDSFSLTYDPVSKVNSSSYDLQFNRSNSAFVNFTPQATDYNAGMLLLPYAMAYTQVQADNSQVSVLGFGSGSSANTTAITAASVSGPGGFAYTFDLTVDKQGNGIDFIKNFSTPLTAGVYTFHITANAIDHVMRATFTPPVVYPALDGSTYQVEDLGNGSIRFSWADANYTGPLYYRVQLWNNTTTNFINTPRQNQTFVDVPKTDLTPLGDLSVVKWRVVAVDSAFPVTQRNRRNGPWSATGVLATLPAYDAGRPVINGYGITSETFAGGTSRTLIWFGGNDPDGTIAEMKVAGPGGYSRNLLTQGVLDGGQYRLVESGSPQPGLYTFTIKDNAGKTAVRYNFQPAASAVAPVDFKTVKLTAEPNGGVRISWAPVAANRPLWYTVQLFSATDGDSSNYPDPVTPPTTDFNQLINKTSVVIPPSASLPTPCLIRIKAQDGGNFTTYNNSSRSVVFKAEAAGFDYGTLADADGDGFASNIDTNDSDPAIYPFSPPVVVGTAPAANATSVAVNTAVNITFNQPIDDSITFNFELKSNGGVVAGGGGYSAATKTITFIPSLPLANGTLYTVTISGVESMTGGKMPAPYSFSFTTAPADTTPPTVVSYSPLKGAVNVPVNTTLTIKFSEMVNSDTMPDPAAFLKTGTTFVPGTGVYDQVNDVHVFTPSAPLAYGTLYTATLSGVKDLAGNPLATPLVFSFTTEPAPTPEKVPPTVTAFTIPITSNALSIPITSLTATDNTAVTGYYIGVSSTAPVASAAGWSGSVPAKYSFPAGTVDGVKTLYAFARDGAGNVSKGLAAKVTVKTSAPVITAVAISTVRPAPAWSPETKTIAGSTALVLKVTATGGAVSYYYAYNTHYDPLDSAAVSTISKSNVLTIPGNTFAEGPVYLRVFASDIAGNEGHSELIVLTVDNTPPVATVSGQPQGLNTAIKKTQIVVGGDGVALYRYKVKFTPEGALVPGVWGKYSGNLALAKPVAIAASKSGQYEVAVIGMDAAGNWQSDGAATTVSWTVDAVPPAGSITTINNSLKPVPAPNPVVLALAYSGNPTGMRFSVDGITWSEWEPAAVTKTFTIPGLPGKKNIFVQFRDLAGNLSKAAKKPFTLL